MEIDKTTYDVLDNLSDAEALVNIMNKYSFEDI
jgi:hypothetical protein